MNEPKLASIRIQMEFVQTPDSNDEGPGDQFISIDLEDAGAGHYYVIQTERWAMDSSKDLADLMKQAESVLKFAQKKFEAD